MVVDREMMKMMVVDFHMKHCDKLNYFEMKIDHLVADVDDLMMVMVD